VIYGSVCSGIEAATVAWRPLGWRCAFVSEIDAYPSAVLAHHYPEVPNYGDFTTIAKGQGSRPDDVDLLVGGTPCQTFSVAGLRAGLDDPRGNLALEFLALADRLRPRWVVWENVPGVLSSITDDAPDAVPPDDNMDMGQGDELVVEDEYDCEETHAFACFLAGLAELGYGFAYRVLDAQWFGVPQRRRRVFVVGYRGDWRPPAAVLLERSSLRGDLAPSREAGEDVAGSLASSSGKRGYGPDEQYVAGSLGGSGDRGPAQDTDRMTFIPDTMPSITVGSVRGEGFDASEDGSGRGTPLVPVDLTNGRCGEDLSGTIDAAQDKGNRGQGIMGFYPTNRQPEFGNYEDVSPAVKVGSNSGGNPPAVAFQEAQTGCREYDSAGSLRANGPGHDPVGTRIREGMQVRRLTPRECERLQGFPDDYTQVPYRGKPASDGPRYKALGNSMAVPCMRWIGERIEIVESSRGMMPER